MSPKSDDFKIDLKIQTTVLQAQSVNKAAACSATI